MATDLDRQIEEKRQRLQQMLTKEHGGSSGQGINHLAVFALDLEATTRFYTEVMGMPVTGVTTNRDEPRSTHMNVDIGNGVSISFFDFPHVERLKVPVPEGVGGMMHVAIPVSPERRDEIEGRLKDHGMEYGDVGGSLYVKDPNGMTMELLSP